MPDGTGTRSMRLLVVLTVLSLLVGTVTGSATPVRAQVQQSLQEYALNSGDLLEIMVLGEPELTRTVTIRPDGKINLPLIGDVEAAGLTPTRLAERITEALKTYLRNPQVSVSIREFQRAFVYVVGQVQKPGAVEIQRGWTVLEVMGVAGGGTPRAALRRASLIRRGTGQAIALDLDRLLLRGDRSVNIAVEPGDIVMVPTLQNRVLVLGYVRSPGAYDLDEGARLADALAAAGGPVQGARMNDVGVIRTAADGKPAVTTVDLNKLLRGDGSQNPSLQNADVVYVKAGPSVSWQNVILWLSGLRLFQNLLLGQ